MVARRLWIIFYSSLMLLALALSLLGGFLEIDREMQRDPARVLELWIGPLQFRVANAFLVFPWPEGTSPESDRATMVQTMQRLHLPQPPSGISSLSFKFDLPDLSPGTLRNDRRLIAIVQYKRAWPIPARTLRDMAGYQDAHMIITPAPEFDTAHYAAFRITPTPAFAQILKSEKINNGSRIDDIDFVSRSGAAPREIACLFANLPHHSPADCTTKWLCSLTAFPLTQARSRRSRSGLPFLPAASTISPLSSMQSPGS